MEYILMNNKQYDEMKSFYESLGYSKAQSERLSKNVFQYEIRVSEKEPYNESWEFYVRRDYGREEEVMPGAGGFFSGVKNMFGGAPVMAASKSMAMPLMKASMVMDDSMVMEDAMAAPLPSMPAPEFNTAKTHVSPEIPQVNTQNESAVIFSANVNNASWSYVRNSIKRGRRIDPSFVRVEEIISDLKSDIKPPEDKTFNIIGERAMCPWNKEHELLLVSLKGMEVKEKKPNHLVYLVDVSGSMQDNVVLEQLALASLTAKLKEGDTISIIAYSDETKTVVRNLDCSDKDKCIDAILNINFISGCTNGSRGLTDAYEFLDKYAKEDANNRIFIFTDGDFNFGITGEGSLADFIKEKKKSGIYLSVVGYGMSNFKDDNMEALSRNGNGNYCFVGCPEDITEKLFEQFEATVYTIAKDVKIKVELNPKYSKSYRLVGYNARKLTQQDFDNTEKAVDGVGSGYLTSALIEYTPGTSKDSGVSRYTSTESLDVEGEFAAVNVRYKDVKDENKEQEYIITTESIKNVSEATQNSSFLAAFALEMCNSEYKGDINKDFLEKLIKEYRKKSEVKKYIPVFEKYLQNK
ncbi:MAG: von Willebrand factor type A domain-containing protein [Firmicutes bacterium]|nr:von Willebrand factor type A domain-containing protein [Bacillota bacterium]